MQMVTGHSNSPVELSSKTIFRLAFTFAFPILDPHIGQSKCSNDMVFPVLQHYFRYLAMGNLRQTYKSDMQTLTGSSLTEQ